MIGDWVYSSFLYEPTQVKHINVPYFMLGYATVKVRGLDDIKDINSLTAIPITKEILEKNGWVKCNEEEDGSEQFEFEDGNTFVNWRSPSGDTPGLFGYGELNEYGYREVINELPINYVHELQHILRLCGINQEIVV